MAAKPRIAIVGPGRLGISLAEALADAGYPLREIVFRGAKSRATRAPNLPRALRSKAVSWQDACLDADMLWLTVPDGQIEPVAQRLATRGSWERRVVFHSSGALTSDALQVLRKQGASVASVHPLMTFVHGSKPSLQGVPFALEGDLSALREARKIIKDFRGDSFLVPKQDKVLYHTWGTFLSPLLLAFVVTAEQVARSTGIPAQSAQKRMLPIVMQTLSNYARRGPRNSFSGPLVRGEVAVIKAHLRALEKTPEAREVYIALAKSALKGLPVRNRRELRKLLEGTIG